MNDKPVLADEPLWLRGFLQVYRRRDPMTSNGTTEQAFVDHIDKLETRLRELEQPDVVLTASARCPLCGSEGPHPHTALEQVIYRNGVKAGRFSHSAGLKS